MNEILSYLGNTATGTYGTVSWNLGNEKLIVMWSVPYSHDLHSNWLALDVKSTHDSSDFERMYSGKKGL